MSIPNSIVVNAVFLAVYGLLLGATFFNVFKQGSGKRMGFILIAVFCIARFVGNALLIAAYKDNYSNKDTIEAGLILQGLGYAFLFSASLAFWMGATSDPASPNKPAVGIMGLRNLLRPGSSNSSPQSAIPQVLHLVNLVALILLIVGYTNSDDLFTFSGSSTAKLDTLAKVGDVLFLVVTVVLAALVVRNILRPGHQHGETRIILFTIVLALPFMIIRAAYVTYQAFTVNPFESKLAERAVLQYTTEVIIEMIYTGMGFMLLRQEVNNGDVESADNADEDTK